MRIKYLKSFYYTARCKSISKASKNLHISQPGLSKQLQKLENNFPAPLFKRSNKGVILTEIGEKVYEYAETILHLENNLFVEIEKISNKEEQLIVAACQNFGSFHFASKIHNFEEKYQEFQVKVDTFNSSAVLNKVLNHDYNLGILIGVGNCDHLFFEKNCEDCPYIDKVDFFEDRFLLCAANTFKKNTISIEELKDISLIMREKDSSAYCLIKEFFAAENVEMREVNISLISNSINITKEAIINGSSLGFIPESAVNSELERGMLKRVEIESDFKDMLKFDYSIIKRKDYQFNQKDEQFKNLLLSIGKQKKTASNNN